MDWICVWTLSSITLLQPRRVLSPEKYHVVDPSSWQVCPTSHPVGIDLSTPGRSQCLEQELFSFLLYLLLFFFSISPESGRHKPLSWLSGVGSARHRMSIVKGSFQVLQCSSFSLQWRQLRLSEWLSKGLTTGTSSKAKSSSPPWGNTKLTSISS